MISLVNIHHDGRNGSLTRLKSGVVDNRVLNIQIIWRAVRWKTASSKMTANNGMVSFFDPMPMSIPPRRMDY